jgi:urease accessory protein
MARLSATQRERSRALRGTPTDAEVALWRILRGQRLAGYRFRRQHPIDRWIADFACVRERLVVEADGGQHGESDSARDQDLAARGWRVLRLWNHEILANPEGTAVRILEHLEEPPPQPSPVSRRGRGSRGGACGTAPTPPSPTLRAGEGEEMRHAQAAPSPGQGTGEGRGGGLPRAVAIEPAGDTVDSITLDHEARHRRRGRLVTDGGLEFLLDLPQAAHLHDGDRLLLDDGRRIRVRAAAEPVLDITAPDLARIAWHLGNRHCPTQILESALRIREDHVLAEMLHGLGATVTPRGAAFEPEAGAYHRHEH